MIDSLTERFSYLSSSTDTPLLLLSVSSLNPSNLPYCSQNNSGPALTVAVPRKSSLTQEGPKLYYLNRALCASITALFTQHSIYCVTYLSPPADCLLTTSVFYIPGLKLTLDINIYIIHQFARSFLIQKFSRVFSWL